MQNIFKTQQVIKCRYVNQLTPSDVLIDADTFPRDQLNHNLSCSNIGCFYTLAELRLFTAVGSITLYG